ncbi:hypothetical protein GW17_00028524 [Ensete ventricosum]|nr:hypothetical protein GW17_00028524 [Ensete ventricosum]
MRRRVIAFALLHLLSLALLASSQRRLVILREDFADFFSGPSALGTADDSHGSEDSAKWDEFGDLEPSLTATGDYDPGSWLPIIESTASSPLSLVNSSSDPREALYFSGVRHMISAAAAASDPADMEVAAAEIEAAASAGLPHAQSALGFLYGTGLMRPQSRSKSFLYHHFAAKGGNMQSKMALAYTYFRQHMHGEAVKLYAELAEVAVASFRISKEPPVIEPIRIHSGTEENKEALRKSRGEADENFQITEYQALKGNSFAMYQMGLLYYYGLRGVRRDNTKALHWLLKAVEKGDPRSMEFLGEMYTRGAGVERNYTKAFKLLTLASKHKVYSAYNGLGYLYVKGYGVEKKNYTKVKS